MSLLPAVRALLVNDGKKVKTVDVQTGVRVVSRANRAADIRGADLKQHEVENCLLQQLSLKKWAAAEVCRAEEWLNSLILLYGSIRLYSLFIYWFQEQCGIQAKSRSCCCGNKNVKTNLWMNVLCAGLKKKFVDWSLLWQWRSEFELNKTKFFHRRSQSKPLRVSQYQQWKVKEEEE